MARSLAELAEREWRLLYLGGLRSEQALVEASDGRALQTAHGLPCLHAVAYHQSVYDQILAEVPDAPTAMALWLEARRGLDHYYAQRFDGRSFVTCPSVATQPALLPLEPPAFELLPLTG